MSKLPDPGYGTDKGPVLDPNPTELFAFGAAPAAEHLAPAGILPAGALVAALPSLAEVSVVEPSVVVADQQLRSPVAAASPPVPAPIAPGAGSVRHAMVLPSQRALSPIPRGPEPSLSELSSRPLIPVEPEETCPRTPLLAQVAWLIDASPSVPVSKRRIMQISLLRRQRCRIGSALGCDITLSVDGVAPEHADIVLDPASRRYLLRDLGGPMGTVVAFPGHQPERVNDTTPIRDGALVQFGSRHAVFIFRSL